MVGAGPEMTCVYDAMQDLLVRLGVRAGFGGPERAEFESKHSVEGEGLTRGQVNQVLRWIADKWGVHFGPNLCTTRLSGAAGVATRLAQLEGVYISRIK